MSVGNEAPRLCAVEMGLGPRGCARPSLAAGEKWGGLQGASKLPAEMEGDTVGVRVLDGEGEAVTDAVEDREVEGVTEGV